MYKLYIDKNENFECDVSVKNASLKDSLARLIVESDNGLNLMFHGVVKNNKCIIPIKRLKGILEENTKGTIHLEVIVEDTYFKPWKSEFIVQEHVSVKVSINEQKNSDRPNIKVKVKENSSNRTTSSDIEIPIAEIKSICEQFEVKNKKDIILILKEYFKSNPEYNKNIKRILNSIYS